MRRLMDVPLISISIATLIGLYAIWAGIKGIKCPNCRSRLELERIDDPYGFNITKKITVSFRKRGRVDSYFTCPGCGKKYLQKHDSEKMVEYWNRFQY